MNNLTQDEIDQLVTNSTGKLSDSFCRGLVAYMSGYLRMSSDTNDARQVWFQQIQIALKTNANSPTFL